MPENINLLLELAVNPGRFEDLKTLIPELVEANRNDAGMLTQELAISDDRQVCHIYERFRTPTLSWPTCSCSTRTLPRDFSKY
jgi:quinol monooxygenase YgiN